MDWLTFAAGFVVAMLVVAVICSRLFGAVKDPPRPTGVNERDWDRISEPHVPHAPGFRRVK